MVGFLIVPKPQHSVVNSWRPIQCASSLLFVGALISAWLRNDHPDLVVETKLNYFQRIFFDSIDHAMLIRDPS